MSYKYTLSWCNPWDPEYDEGTNKIILYTISTHNSIKESFEGVKTYVSKGVRSYYPILLTEEHILEEFNKGKKRILLTTQYKDEGEIYISRTDMKS